ncbi:Retrovirus-related Pol polyprotein from transposon gypsy, partial [Mucuna pruriens]
MYSHDEEKIAFITDADAFCYKVMPFGLKNTEATYQRLMDKIFKEVMGVDVEVYVDDMVVKSHSEGSSAYVEPKKMFVRCPGGEFLGLHVDREGNRGKPGVVLGHNRHEKPTECERGRTTHG